MTATLLRFPAGFVLGAATAAYQIEGAVAADGRGASIWDVFSHTPGAISTGESGDVTCDHYRRWPEDVALLQRLNLDAYRFSVAWPRILPAGRGRPNPAGLAFYDRLVDALLEAGITPYPTLYHWDLPQALQAEGGWLRRGIVDDFCAYAEVVGRALGDRVRHWTTLNEPWTFCWEGHAWGEDAPGLKLGAWGALTASHHALLAHGRAVPVLREVVPGAKVGIVLDLNAVEPASASPADVAAAGRFDGAQNRWYLDALFRGSYPEDMLEVFAGQLPEVRTGDLAATLQPLDFLGVNYYRRSVMAAGTELPPLDVRRIRPAGSDYTQMGWEVYPQGLGDVLAYVHERYRPPALYVTENGAAFPDLVTADGRVRDPDRAAYLAAHLEEAVRALEAGIPLRGFFVWSLVDNFEWAFGSSRRFGVVHVDFSTQKRTIKDSGHLLAELAGRQRG